MIQFDTKSIARQLACFVLGIIFFSNALFAGNARPNIVFLMSDDQCCYSLGCYGNQDVQTPNVDQLASEGVKFTNAIVTAPVCLSCRSAFITGIYQTSIGAHHHRSGRGKLKC